MSEARPRTEPATTRVLRNAEAVLPDRTLLADIVIRGPVIDALAPAGEGDAEIPGGAAGEVHDLGGRRVTPGLIDLHIHGALGIDFQRDPPERVAEAAARLEELGVTTLLLTLVPAPEEELLDTLATAARACDLSQSFAGIHLEGPFIARDRRGALPEAGVLPYDDALMERILSAAAGKLRILTFAPEAVPPAALRRIRSRGVSLSIGHTAADAARTRAAIDAGAWRATHLCNAMPPVHHRATGPALECLLDPRVRCEVICDGVHVDDRVIALARRLKGPEGVVAVSDAMPLAGLGAAAGTFCGHEVQSDGTRAILDDGTLAGSAMLLPEALRRTTESLDLTPQERVALGCSAPALDLGLTRNGRIGRGCRADLAIWEREAAVAVIRGGEGALPSEWRVR